MKEILIGLGILAVAVIAGFVYLSQFDITPTILIGLGILAVAVIAGFVYLSQFDITPTDTKIILVLEKNKESLLSINGVVGAGIARNESNNYIIGIAVYVEDEITDTQKIPSILSEFKIYVKRISEASEFEKERMIIRR